MPQGTTSFRTLTTLLCVKYIHVGEEGEKGMEENGEEEAGQQGALKASKPLKPRGAADSLKDSILRVVIARARCASASVSGQ